jgi:hypothetical protein
VFSWSLFYSIKRKAGHSRFPLCLGPSGAKHSACHPDFVRRWQIDVWLNSLRQPHLDCSHQDSLDCKDTHLAGFSVSKAGGGQLHFFWYFVERILAHP